MSFSLFSLSLFLPFFSSFFLSISVSLSLAKSCYVLLPWGLTETVASRGKANALLKNSGSDLE
jgi:hypothetical protein